MAQSVSFDAVYQYINSVAPFETQAGFDNSGFLVGKRGDIAQGVLFALDVTDAVLDEAERLGANLIVTHHPLMFSPIHALLEDDYEGRLIMRMVRNRMGLIAAHTNLDSAPGGINDTLCSVLGLTNVSGEGYFRVGDLPQKRTFGSLVENIEKIGRAHV